MKQVLLKITGKQYTENASDPDPIEFVTEGRLYERGETVVLEYDESELSGMDGCKTLLEIAGDRVRMTRSGDAIPLDTVMEFEPGKRSSSLYQTSFGPIEMELLTYSVRNTIPRPGSAVLSQGAVSIDYHVSLKGLGEIRNLLEIAVLEDKGAASESALN